MGFLIFPFPLDPRVTRIGRSAVLTSDIVKHIVLICISQTQEVVFCYIFGWWMPKKKDVFVICIYLYIYICHVYVYIKHVYVNIYHVYVYPVTGGYGC